MKFDFTKIEGLDPELAAKMNGDDAVQSALTVHIDDSVSNRVKVKAEEFKGKMDSLDAKLKAAEERAASAPDIDADELKALREARDKNPELQATLDAIKKKAEESEREAAERIAQQGAELQSLRLATETDRAIAAYNKAHPTVPLQPDAARMVHKLAPDALRYDDAAKAFRVYNGNEIAVTDQGAATPVDFIAGLREEYPSLFAQPSGAGAAGSSGTNGAGGKSITRVEFDRLPPVKQAEVARTHTMVDG